VRNIESCAAKLLRPTAWGGFTARSAEVYLQGLGEAGRLRNYREILAGRSPGRRGCSTGWHNIAKSRRLRGIAVLSHLPAGPRFAARL